MPDRKQSERRTSPDASAPDIPLQPALAPGVELSGEMPESGFQEKQWLIQRNGDFLQVSELIYRVAEALDGRRSIEEIAAEVTRASPWQVEAEHIRHLLRTKLLPLGLITTAGRASRSVSPAASTAPLGFVWKRRLLGRSALEAISNAGRILFAPQLLIPLLLVVSAGHFWLYFSQDIGTALQATLLTPGWLLAVIGIYLFSGLIHELGHAAALSYGGGKPRGLGVGIYIIYPAFYTDTTDSYRLSRRDRVRTDLGGFYFHLLFALLLMGLYLLGGQPYLLVTILLINLDILVQSVPLFRFDGYWILNDVTGVPDFLSQMAPFARSLVAGSTGEKLPTLKPWARSVFVGYILLTVPLLLALVVTFALRLPTVFSMVWSSVQIQLGAFRNAQQTADPATMATALLQLFILSLPLLAVPYLLHKLVWRPATSLWTRPAATSKGGALLIVVAAAALAVFYWFPATAAKVTGPAVPEGVESFEVADRRHVDERVEYGNSPPVGGPHFPVWQNCGFYRSSISEENAVHSLEHGAVWITYRPDLPEGEVTALEELSLARSHLLVSEQGDIPSPIVASAWGRQLMVESANDQRLGQFIEAFHLGSQAPESGAPCSGGVGDPDLP